MPQVAMLKPCQLFSAEPQPAPPRQQRNVHCKNKRKNEKSQTTIQATCDLVFVTHTGFKPVTF